MTAAAAMALIAALVLGLRHATDPDHLTAVATLVLGQAPDSASPGRRAGALGLAWGAGHAVTLLALGLPVVFLGGFLPASVHRAAEVGIGVMIVALAARLLVRWRRGYFHMHPHVHGGAEHAHPHFHDHAPAVAHPAAAAHGHRHPDAASGRGHWAAFGVGLAHGVGGSAGAGVLLAAALPDAAERTLALAVYAAGTAFAMGLVSGAVGHLVGTTAGGRRIEAAIPVFAVGGMLFGAWYVLAAVGVLS